MSWLTWHTFNIRIFFVLLKGMRNKYLAAQCGHPQFHSSIEYGIAPKAMILYFVISMEYVVQNITLQGSKIRSESW